MRIELTMALQEQNVELQEEQLSECIRELTHNMQYYTVKKEYTYYDMYGKVLTPREYCTIHYTEGSLLCSCEVHVTITEGENNA